MEGEGEKGRDVAREGDGLSGGERIRERIAAYLYARPCGVPATELARRFLRIQDPRPAAAGRLIASILEGDPRFRLLGRHVWAPGEEPAGGEGGDRPAGEEGERPLLYAAARPSPAGGDRMLYGLLRLARGEEAGSTRFGRSRRAAGGAPDEAAALLSGARLVIYAFASPFAFLRRTGDLLPDEPIRLRRLAASIIPRERLRSPEEAARRLGLAYDAGDDPVYDARLLAAIHAALLERSAAVSPPGESAVIPFLRDGGRAYLDALPERPGIYFLREGDGELLYIGKSRSLRSRVASYFHAFETLSPEKREMVRKIGRIDARVVGCEAEALIAEWRAIRRRRPPYNEKMEVRSGPPPAASGRDLILFLPSTDAGSVTLFLLRKDGAMDRLRARRNARKTGRLAGTIERFFRFGPGRFEPDAYVILTRWIDAHRDEVTLLDVARQRDFEDLMRLVVESLHDREITSGRRLDRI